MGALRVTVSSSILSTGFVGGVLARSTVFLHLGEVECSVETARKLGDVNVESELLVQEVEHLVLGVAVHEVDARANVGVFALGNELEGKGITAGADTVNAPVVGTFQGAVLGTCSAIGTESFVPGTAGVTIGVSSLVVEPAPVGVECYGRGHILATASRSTFLPLEGGVCLSSDVADELPIGNRG